jgi:exodeoxyribonuclease-3
LKIITWNCQGALRRKFEIILKRQPDILVVQESERPDKVILNNKINPPTDYYWHGDNIHKGIGIYSFSDYKFEFLPIFNPEFRYILPFRVTGKGKSFILLAIWAMSNKVNYSARYIGQVWRAINYYESLLAESIILVGDFNSNKIWNYKKRVGSHSDVVRKLADNKIESVYHRYFNLQQGEEKDPTFYLQRKRNKPYHIDYCFASGDFLDKLQEVKIGTYENWIIHSDHAPLIINFNI